MGEAVATTEERLAATMVRLNESRALLASCAQRLGVKEQGGQVATTASLATTTTPMFVQDRVGDKPATNPLSPSLMSKHRVMAFGALHEGVVLAPATPTRCSTFVLTSQEGSGAGARVVDIDQSCSKSFPNFDGTNPGLWQVQCLQYFNRFSVSKCSWVIAATMHMEGKAKVWYEAYRLRQAVGDWSEFMDNVESHFGVADLPPLAPIMGIVRPSFNVHASEGISPATTTECLSESPKEVMGKASVPMELTLAQITERIKLQFAQLKLALASEYEERKKKKKPLGTVNQMAVSIADSSKEVLTHVSGVSLFLEPWVESAQTICSETTLIELADEVFTNVGGLSLFLELDMDDDASRAMPMVSQGVTCTTTVSGVFADCNPPTLSYVVLVCDDAEHAAAYGLSQEVLQHDDVAWKPWPPDLQVCVSHKKRIGRPRPWPSFHCNQLKDVQMTLAMLPWRTTYLVLPTETLATQNWDPGIPRFACTDLFCRYVILVCRCLLYPSLQRKSQLLTQVSKTCHAFLDYYGMSLTLPWDPGDWCSLQFFDQGLQYLLGFCELWCWHEGKHERNEKRNVGYAILGLIRNSDVLLICTSLWPTEMKMDMDFTAANNLSLVLCHLLNAALKVGHAYEMEEPLETLFVVTLPHASQSRMHTAKYDFLMWPSKHVQMPWDPGDVHNNTISARLTQCIVCLCLERPWDPGIIVIHKPTVSDDLSAEVGATKCCNLIKPLLGDKQCFLGAVMSYPSI